MLRRRMLVLGIALLSMLAGATAALNYWRHWPLDRALVSAVKSNDSSMVRLLLLKGADPNTRDDAHLSLATGALLSDHTDIAELLLSRGATVDAEFCLQDAVNKGRLEQVSLLLEHGARTNANGLDATRLLFQCIESGEENVRALLDRGADPNGRDSDGQTPLILASGKEDRDTVRLLLERGANPNTPGRNRDNALLEACRHFQTGDNGESAAVVEALMAHSADPAAADIHGETPVSLLLAANRQVKSPPFDRCLALLVSRPRDPGVRRTLQATALDWAVQHCQVTTVQALIDAGADPDACLRNGPTPLFTAVHALRSRYTYSDQALERIARLLAAHGADPRAGASNGQSVLDETRLLAANRRYGDLLQTLEQLTKHRPTSHAISAEAQ